jgi:hypothetical protein
MKKKMLFMAAIAGLVTLGSCVKDDVSGSVEAVRQAKANQLNADANQKNATAEHIKALQAADLALQQATAAAQAATAKLTEAQALAAELDNQVAQAALADEIAAQVAQYKMQTANRNTNLQTALNNLASEIAKGDDIEFKRVQALIKQFQNAYDDWVDAQNDLVDAKAALATAQVSAEYAQKQIDTKVAKAQENLEIEEAVLAFIKEQGQKGKTEAEIKARLQVITEELKELKLDYQNSAELPAFVKASNAITNLWTAFKAAEAQIEADKDALTKYGNPFVAGKEKGGVDSKWVNKYGAESKVYVSYTILGANGKDEIEKTSYKYFDTTSKKIDTKKNQDVNFNGRFTTYTIDKKDNLDAIKNAIKKDSVSVEDAFDAKISYIGTKADKATTTDPNTGLTTWYADLKALQNTLDDAKDVLRKATVKLDNDQATLAQKIADKTVTAADYAAVDADYTDIYGAVTSVPASVTDVAAWKASAASIAYRPNDKAP